MTNVNWKIINDCTQTTTKHRAAINAGVKDVRDSFDFPAPLCDLTGALDTTTDGTAAHDGGSGVQKQKKSYMYLSL